MRYLSNPYIVLTAAAGLFAGALIIPADGVMPDEFSWLGLGASLGMLLGIALERARRGGR